MSIIFVNGQLQSSISATDRGVLYGDSLFETIAVLDGVPLMLDEHFSRLKQGGTVLGIPVDLDDLRFEVFDFIEHVSSEDFDDSISISSTDVNSSELDSLSPSSRYIIRITLTRGEQSRGYQPSENSKPTRIISFHDWPSIPMSYYSRGINLGVSDVYYSHQELLAGIKHCNRLEQVLAAQSIPMDCDDVIMLDQRQCVISTTKANLFLKLKGEWQTADLKMCGINGITRAAVLDYFIKNNIKHRVRKISYIQLELNPKEIEAAFVCNSIIGIVPVCSMLGLTLKSNEFCTDLRQYLSVEDVIG